MGVVSLKFTEDFNCGPIMITRNSTLDPSGRSHSHALLMPQVSLLIRSPSRPSSLTLLLESVLEFSLRRTIRKSLLTCQEMAVSVDLVTLRVIFPASDSRSSRPLAAHSLLFG